MEVLFVLLIVIISYRSRSIVIGVKLNSAVPLVERERGFCCGRREK